jgi:NTP pyrophosphatase (non-canonical NTP hydrolase)
MEGLVSDVGDLMKLVMAREGFRKIDETNSKLAHELSDCLWCILVLASEYGIDIERSFIEEMNKLGSKTS